MSRKTRTIIGLISSLVLGLYGAYYIFTSSFEPNWTHWLLMIAGFISFFGGLWELRKFNTAEK